MIVAGATTHDLAPPPLEKNRYVYTCNYPTNCRGGLGYNGSCFEGQAGVDSCAPDLCSITSEGPLCGKCKWTEPHAYMKDEICYRCKGGETAAVISVLVVFIGGPTTVAFVLYRFAHLRALSYRLYRRVFDIGRFKVVWVNYQIMTTVAWNVQIVWPEPFATFERLLSVLDLSLLRLMPVACIVPCELHMTEKRHEQT